MSASAGHRAGAGGDTARAAIVTGGSRGIGAAIVKRLAVEGVAVAFTYRSSDREATQLVDEVVAAGGRALAIKADCADVDEVVSAVEEANREFGRLDILVNNAAVGLLASLEGFPIAEFDRMVAVNVKSVFVAIQAAARRMGPGGRVITIGSVNADRVPVSGIAVYSMTKAALGGLTRGLARELGAQGITINLLQPGPTDTDMNPDSGEFADAIRQFLAVGRYAKPVDIAGAVAYLASEEAWYVTGATWDIDGGFAA